MGVYHTAVWRSGIGERREEKQKGEKIGERKN
jgi:hypothetical protein